VTTLSASQMGWQSKRRLCHAPLFDRRITIRRKTPGSAGSPIVTWNIVQR
jgi:hypothetical protein